MNVKSPEDEGLKTQLIEKINSQRNLGLTQTEIANFRRNTTVGVPFSQLKSLLAMDPDKKYDIRQAGIPADSTNNELAEWISAAKGIFYERDPNMQVIYMIKGDNDAKYPSFNGVVEAMRKSDQFVYKLVTDPQEVPTGTELYKERRKS
jgi:hypothetical protein